MHLHSSVHVRIAKGPETESRQNTQANGQRLSRLDGSRDRAAGKDNRGEESQFDTVSIAVVNTVAAEHVLLRRLEVCDTREMEVRAYQEPNSATSCD